MEVIYKYTLSVTDEQTLTLPEGSKILSVLEQGNKIVLYALVDVNKANTRSEEDYSIVIVGTGNFINSVKTYTFLGTVKLADGALMFHVLYRAI